MKMKTHSLIIKVPTLSLKQKTFDASTADSYKHCEGKGGNYQLSLFLFAQCLQRCFKCIFPVTQVFNIVTEMFQTQTTLKGFSVTMLNMDRLFMNRTEDTAQKIK